MEDATRKKIPTNKSGLPDGVIPSLGASFHRCASFQLRSVVEKSKHGKASEPSNRKTPNRSTGGSLKFSVRESQIMELLCHGFANKTIAQQLDISPHTVRDHLSAMCNRFHVKGRAALVTVYLHWTAAHAPHPRINVNPK